MWCKHCRQDVAGKRAGGDNLYCCPRCQAALTAGRAFVAASTMQHDVAHMAVHGVELGASPGDSIQPPLKQVAASAAHGVELGGDIPAPKLFDHDDWLLDREIERLERFRQPSQRKHAATLETRTPIAATLSGKSAVTNLAPWVPPEARAAEMSPVPLPIVGADLSRAPIAPQNTLTRVFLSLGSSLFAVGAGMLLMGSWPEYAVLWRHAFAPIFAGQFLLLAGVLQHLGLIGGREAS